MRFFKKLCTFVATIVEQVKQTVAAFFNERPELSATLAYAKHIAVEAITKSIPIAKTLPIRTALAILDCCDHVSFQLHGWLTRALRRSTPTPARATA